MAGFIGAAGFVGVVSVAGCGGYCRVWWVLQELSTEIKKSFFSFFTLTPSQMWLKRPVYRGFSGEGRCFLPSHYPHTSGTGKYPVRGLFTDFNKSTRKV